jgi:hypothetical protein
MALDVGVEVRALRAICAVLRTAARLDAEQLGALHVPGSMVQPMCGGCFEDEIE